MFNDRIFGIKFYISISDKKGGGRGRKQRGFLDPLRFDPYKSVTLSMFRVAFALLIFAIPVCAAEPRVKTVEEITDKARNSVVVITQRARDGSVEGVGSG